MPQIEQLQLRVDPEIKDWIRDQAWLERVSMNRFVNMVLAAAKQREEQEQEREQPR